MNSKGDEERKEKSRTQGGIKSTRPEAESGAVRGAQISCLCDHHCSFSSIMPPYTPGIAPIKAEYLVSTPRESATAAIQSAPIDDDAAESHTNPAQGHKRAASPDDDQGAATASTDAAAGDGAPTKLKGGARKKAKKAERAAEKAAGSSGGGGQNKNRKFNTISDGFAICNAVAEGKACPHGDK